MDVKQQHNNNKSTEKLYPNRHTYEHSLLRYEPHKKNYLRIILKIPPYLELWDLRNFQCRAQYEKLFHIYPKYSNILTSSLTNSTIFEFRQDWTKLKVFGHTTMFFKKSKRRIFLCLPVCFPGKQESSERRSTLKGRNLLLWEQILSFKSWTLLRKATRKMTRVASPESVPFTLNCLLRYNCLNTQGKYDLRRDSIMQYIIQLQTATITAWHKLQHIWLDNSHLKRHNLLG